MKKTIKIGEKEVALRASALTSQLYKNLFGEDLIKELPNIKDNSGIDKMIGLAFVMNFQAEAKNALDEAKDKLTMRRYYEWLDSFEQMELLNAEVITEITNLWLGNIQTLANAKNLNRPR